VSACTNMAVFCSVIVSVPVPIWQCSVLESVTMGHCSIVLYCECLCPRGSALLCDTVTAFTNVAVLCCVILSVPLPMWQSSVVWYCQCLTNVAVFCCVISSLPLPMWQCFCDRACCYWLRGYHLSGRLLTRNYSLFLTHITSGFGWKRSQENA